MPYPFWPVEMIGLALLVASFVAARRVLQSDTFRRQKTYEVGRIVNLAILFGLASHAVFALLAKSYLLAVLTLACGVAVSLSIRSGSRR